MAEGERWKGGDFGERETAERRALTVSWVFIAIDFIARELLTSQAEMYLQGGDDDLLVRNHPFTQILANPNPHMDGAFLQMFTSLWQELDGSAYWFLATDVAGQLAEIWPLPARYVKPIPGDKDRFVDHYEYQQHGRIFRIPYEYICHMRYPHPFNIFDGMSRLTAGMMAADADLAMARWNGAFFGSDNVMPSVHINLASGNAQAPIDPADVRALKDELEDDYSAYRRKTLITNAQDVSFNMMGYSQHDMDFLGGRELTKKEIFLIFGIPPGMLDVSATEANATVADAIFKEKKLWPLLLLRQGQINNQIIRRFYGDGWLLKYKDIRPRNRTQDIQEVAQIGAYLTIDEVRAKYYNLPALPAGRGEKTSQEINLSSAMSANPALMVPSTETHVPEGSVDPEKGGAALPAPQAEVKTIFATGATETAEIKTPDGELKLWRNKAIKGLANGKGAGVKFETEAIDEELAEEIRGALEMAEVKADVKAIFELAERSPLPPLLRGAKSTGIDGAQIGANAIAAVRSWRPWSEYEARLMDTLQAGLQDQAKRIIEEMRKSDPQAMLMDDELWGRFERDLLHDMEGDLTQLARSTVSRVQLAQGPVAPGMEINWGLANQNAVDWARSDAASKVKKINETTRQAIRDEVSDWSKQGGTLDDLTARIEGMTDGSGNPVFDRRRAQLIASTEATDTYAAANNQAWQAAGYAPAAFRPAAHPGCRCYLRPMTLKDGTKVMVWNTARDELVCKKPITTPWGQVEGCGGLNGVAVSEGPHMGEQVA
jgi:phage portal protein BeeE